ncbi:hypothetical protein C0416_03215 [bacterium]|nr:hypothetical protein [bacterium]
MADEKKEGILQVEALINEGNLKEAYSVCNKLLLNFPENGKIRSLQKKIEKTVYEQNLKIVKSELDTLKPLWKEKRYKEIVEKLESLKSYVPGYGPIEKDLFKAKKLYRDQLIEGQKLAVDDYVKNIEKLIAENKFQEAIVESKKFLAKIPGHEKVALLEKKAKDLFVVQKLKENEFLLKSDKFDEIEALLKELIAVNPESGKLKLLLEKASKRQTVALSYEKKDFVFQSFEHIKILAQKKKWEKTIDALIELLKVDPGNMNALELLDKARRKFDRQLTGEVIEKIFELQKKFKAQKLKNPQSFIKL